MDKVSIVVPVYNGEKYIGHCLDTLISQSYSNIEIIIIDDGSLDGTKDISCEYANVDDRIIYLYQDNAGVSAARNLGMSVATGEYICFVDSDDYVTSDYVSQLVSLMSEDTDLAVAGHYVASEAGEILGKSPPIYGRSLTMDANVVSMDRDKALWQAISMKGFQGYPFCKLFRKSIIDSALISFDLSISNLEDLLFVVTYLLVAAKEVHVSMKPVYYYVKQNNSVRVKCKTSKVFEKSWLSEMESLDRIVNLLAGNSAVDVAKARRALSAVFYLKRMNRCGYEDKKLMKRYQRYIRCDLLKAYKYREGDVKWILSGIPYAIALPLGKLFAGRKND